MVAESAARDVGINIHCQPEHIHTDIEHPFCNTFWYIRRSHRVKVCNSALVGIKTKVITSVPMSELKTDSYHHKPDLFDFEVTIPCIVNNVIIKCGTEIVLLWEFMSKPPKTNQKRIFITSSAGATKYQKIIVNCVSAAYGGEVHGDMG